MKPDGIYIGMIEKLGWRKNQADSSMLRFKFNKVKLSDFISQLKLTFPGNSFRVVGNPDMMVTNVALAVGAPGSVTHLKLLQEKDIHLLITGEASEWETYQADQALPPIEWYYRLAAQILPHFKYRFN